MTNKTTNQDRAKELLFEYFDDRPHNTFIKQDNWVQCIDERDETAFKNGVLFSLLDEKNADNKVKEVVNFYKEKKIDFRWVIGDFTQPDNLEQILIDNGGILHSVSTNLKAKVSNFKPLTHPDIELEFVTKNTTNIYCDILNNVFASVKLDPKQIELSLLEDLSATPQKWFYILMKYKGDYIGTGGFKVMSDFIYMTAAAILPEFQGKGLFKYLQFPDIGFDFVNEKNIKYVMTSANKKTAAPILSKYGFEFVNELKLYMFFNREI